MFLVWEVTNAPDWFSPVGGLRITSTCHRRILRGCNLFSIEVSYVRTICNVVVDLVDHIRLAKSGISNHFALNTRVPGGALNESLGARTDGEEIDLGCGGLDLH